MQKFFLFFILLFLSILFTSCGDSTQTVDSIKCDTNLDCNGGTCGPAGTCLVYACSPNENTCLEDGKTAKVCKDDLSGFEEITCGFRCNKGECIDQITCSPYTKMCINDTEYIECSSNGLDWEKTECDSGKLCLDGACTDKVCTPLEKECTDSFHVKSCNANGTAELNYKCPNSQQCIEGSCVEISCTANDTKCVNGQLVTCSSDGSTWGNPVECGDNKACDDGECRDVICNEGEIVCSTDSNRYYKKCDGTNTGWGNPVLCEDNKVCNNNECVQKLCFPGEKTCDADSKVITCNDDSLSWSEAVECEGTDVCKRGACTATGTCSPNEKQCLDGNDGYFEACDEWGTAWLNPVSCGAGNICVTGECVDIICNPNEVKCDTSDNSMDKYKVCNDNGTAYLAQETCSNGEVCLGDACRTITCIPGEKICDNNEIMECNEDGSVRESILNCGDTKSCVNGECIDKVCTPDLTRCVEGTTQFIEVCNSTGTSWINRLSCGTGSICSNDACVSLVCSPGQTKCDVNLVDSYLTCNDEGSSFDDLTDCPSSEFCMTGLCMECFPGNTECINDDNFRTCNNDGRWEDAISCVGGDKCENGSCAVKICEANEVECLTDNPQYFKTCNSLGTAWLNPVSCGAGNTCESNLCTPILCVRDTTECFSSSSYIECNSTGTSYSNPIACNNGDECLGGSCRSTVCTPGEKVCEDNGIKECNELGQWDVNIISCGANVCELGVCNSVICTPTEYRCDVNNSNYREQCNSTGTAWINNAPCGTSKTCNLGVCENIICSSGDSICSGTENGYQTCNTLGTAYDSTILCGGSEYCNSGLCVAQVCTPNEKVCDGNSVKICNDLGSNYSNPQACTDGTICNSGICESTICNSGETRCDGALIQSCSTDGTTWEAGIACPGGQTCSGNQCIDYVCAVNERECVNNSLYKECNTTRTGFSDPIACGTNKICTGAGVCEDRLCAPGQTKCVTTDLTYKTYQVCNSTGSAWENPVSCSGSLICDVDTNVCKSVICTAGDLRCLDDNGTPQSQTCNTTGSGWETAITCGGINPICIETGCDNVICNAYEEIQCTGNTDTEYRRCNVTGTDWITATENCADNYLCKDNSGTDECTPVICTPDSIVCSSDTGYRTCNSDGTVLSNEATCANSAASGQPMTCYAGECRTECDMAAVNKSYMGCEYYAIELENYGGTYDDGTYAIIVSNPGDYTTSVSVDGPNGINQTANISPNNLEIFTFSNADREPVLGTNRGTDYSYLVTSDLPIVVYQFSPLGGASNYTNDASLLMPTTAYGTEYRSLSWESLSNGSPEYITIVAKENNTIVMVIPKVDTDAGGGVASISAGDTFTVTLSAGEVIQLGTNSGGDNLSGSLITSDKPIGVFGSNSCVEIPIGQERCDHVEQQLFPTSTWGNHYWIVKTSSRNKLVDQSNTVEEEYYKIVAVEDDTAVNFSISINGSTSTNLSAGDTYTYNTNQNYEITSNKAIMVGQFISSVEDTLVWDTSQGVNNVRGGDPAFILQVPIAQFREDYLFLVPDTYTYNYVTIIAPSNSSISQLNYDNNGALTGSATYDVANSSDFNVLGGGYSYAIIDLGSNGGSYSLVSDLPVGISVYGYDAHVSYGYPGGLNLKAVK